MQTHDLKDEAAAIKEWMVQIRRDIHRQPELGYEEVKTAARIRQALDEMGVSYRWPLAETGILATIGSGENPCVALRADMDALPIQEDADVPFRSQTDGKMHACGHDCHVSMLLGAVKLLKSHESELNGTVKFIFQPAEEGGAGGRRMREAGVLQNPTVQRIFGLHIWPALPTGTIGGRVGTFLAATSGFSMEVTGKGGHAAMPHLTIDPVVTAAKIVCELQTIVSRELDPLNSGIVSVSAVNGGHAHNVIPQSVKMMGTVRSLTADGIRYIRERVEEISRHIAQANRCDMRIDWVGAGYPATVNDAHCWQLAQNIGREMLGDSNVAELAPVMGGEDFSFYVEEVPGTFVGLGTRNEAIGATFGLHHPKFKADEDALPIGAALHTAFALRTLAELAY